MLQKIYRSNTKNSEITPYPLCLENTSKDFFVDNRASDIIDITNVLKFLMKT